MSKDNNNLYFGFKAYSKTISDILSESLNDNKKSLTIGIFGEWGSGKSRLLAEIKDSFKEDDKIIPIQFNAWRFEKEEHIIIPMLKSAFYEIEKNKKVSTIDPTKDDVNGATNHFFFLNWSKIFTSNN